MKLIKSHHQQLTPRGHAGPPLALLGVVFAGLFVAGSVISSAVAGKGYVSPFAEETAILDYFRSHANAVRLHAFFLFCAAIPLGIFTATVVSQLHFLGRNCRMFVDNGRQSHIKRPFSQSLMNEVVGAPQPAQETAMQQPTRCGVGVTKNAFWNGAGTKA